jgi:hypothetical protein
MFLWKMLQNSRKSGNQTLNVYEKVGFDHVAYI